jgi:hypothetical protein
MVDEIEREILSAQKLITKLVKDAVLKRKVQKSYEDMIVYGFGEIEL